MISTAILAFVPTPMIDEASWSPGSTANDYIQETQVEETQYTETVVEEPIDYAASTQAVEESEPVQEVRTSSVSPAQGGIAATALSYQGYPYVYGGKTPSGWDCSGFVSYVYGGSIPSQTSAIRASSNTIQVSDPQPGDIVFQNGGSHVGIYLGEDLMISARNPSMGTSTHPIHGFNGGPSGYYRVVG